VAPTRSIGTANPKIVSGWTFPGQPDRRLDAPADDPGGPL